MRKMICSALAGLLLPMAAQAYTYNIQVIGTLGTDYWSTSNGVNDLGQVVGQSVGYYGPSAFWYGSGSMHFIPMPLGYSRANAYGINSSGQVVGTYGYSNYAGEYSAVSIYDIHTNAMAELGSLGFDSAYGYGINSSGAIVGGGYLAGSNTYHAFLRKSDGTLVNLNDQLSGSIYSEAFDINDAGQVVGVAAISGVGNRGFIYDSVLETMTVLDTTNGYSSRAQGINGLGQAVGQDSSMYRAAAVRFDGLSSFDLGNPNNGQAVAINDAGAIVGSFGTGGGSHAFIYDQTGFHDLNDLIWPMPGWEIYSATDINQSGQITAFGYVGSEGRALLLTPVPEPASAALLLLAGGWVVGRSARRRHAISR